MFINFRFTFLGGISLLSGKGHKILRDTIRFNKDGILSITICLFRLMDLLLFKLKVISLRSVKLCC